MSRRSSRQRAVFTVSQANATLPLVKAIVGDLTRLAREVAERRQRLAMLSAGRPREHRDPYQEELAQIEEELQKDTRQLQEYVEELRQLGVEPKSAAEGLVDFPTQIGGREAYLCWKLGEPEVLFWHELDAGFVGRQPLAVGAGVGEGGEDEAVNG